MIQVLAPTITVLPPDMRGAVLICGSHGGAYPGHLAALAGVRAVIFNDAGIGRDEAGVASLGLLQGFAIAAATVSHASCRIGDADDMLLRGVVSRCNAAAAACGVREGLGCAAAATLLESAAVCSGTPAKPAEARSVRDAPPGGRRIVLADSAALVEAGRDDGAIVVTGSHGGLIGGDPRKALKAQAFAALFNDAGIGMDEAGVTRLPALDLRGIAAVTVASRSARIGEAQSTLEAGAISRANATALRLGAREGMSAAEIVERWSRGQLAG